MYYLFVGLLGAVGPFFFPLNNGVVFAASVVSGRVDVFAAAAAIAAGSTIGFAAWYAIGRSSRMISPKWRERIDRIPQRYRGATGAMTFTAAAASVPPMTAVAIMLGSTRNPAIEFVFFTLAGRLVRLFAGAFAVDTLVRIFQNSPRFETVRAWFG